MIKTNEKRFTTQIITFYIIYTVWHIIFWIALIQIINLLSWSDFDPPINRVFLAVSSFLHTQYTLGQMMLLASVYYQLKMLNKSLKENMKNFDELSIKSLSRQSSIIYDALCDVCDEFSKFYAIFVIIYFTALIIFTVYCNFICFVLIQSPSYHLFFFLCYFLLWLFICMPFILWTLTFSSLIATEGRKTADILYKVVEYKKLLNSRRISENFHLQIMHRQPKISCGLYDINWKSFFVFACLVFSFSIILIQFYDV